MNDDYDHVSDRYDHHQFELAHTRCEQAHSEICTIIGRILEMRRKKY